MSLKDGESLGKEKPGESSEVWESEGDTSVDLDFFFFFLLGVVGSVSEFSSEESTYGGPISFSDSFLPAMLWVSKVEYKSWTTVALKWRLPAGLPSRMHCTELETLPRMRNFCPP